MGLLSGIGSFFRPAPVVAPVTADEPEEPLDGYKADLHRMNLITIGRNFTPDDVISFRKRARWGDPRYLYAMYDEWLRLGPGPQRTRAIESLKSANATYVTTPVDWDDEHSRPEDGTPAEWQQARDARDYIEEALEPHRPELVEIHGDEYFYGIAASKIRLEPRGISDRYDAIEEVIPVPQRRFRLNAQAPYDWQLMLSPDSWEGTPVSQLGLPVGCGREGLFFTEIGAGANPLDQRGLFFQVLVPWGIHQNAVRWRARRAELFDTPPRIGFTDTTNPKRATAMRNALRDMGATFYGVFHRDPGSSAQDDVKLLEPSSAGAADPQEAQIEWCLRQYDQAILGHSQTSGVQKGAGSRTSSGDAMEQFENLTNSRGMTLAGQIQRGLARCLVARAFGEEVARKHTPRINFLFVQRDDPKVIAEIALILAQAGLSQYVAAEDVIRRTSFRVATPGEKTFTLPSAGAGPIPAAALSGQGLSAEKSAEIAREFRALMTGTLDQRKRKAIEWARARVGKR